MTQTATTSCAVRENVDLAPLTTFRVPARARFFAAPETVEELTELLTSAPYKDEAPLVLGGGSNILFTQDWSGLVVHPAMRFFELADENDNYRFVRLGAGLPWSELVDQCVARDWPGLENLSLIPGTVGGAAVQNIGAYGMEIAEVISSVEVWDPQEQKVRTLSAEDCDFGYRSSFFKKPEGQKLVVVAVTLALPKAFTPRVAYKELEAWFGDKVPANCAEVADAVKAIRRKKLPDPAVLPNVGSFFKNPVVSRVKMLHLLEDDARLVAYPLAGGRAKLAAGWLIDAAGMKGKREGDAGVFERHSLVLVNYGHATGKEILALSQEVSEAVWRRYGVRLEPEPVII